MCIISFTLCCIATVPSSSLGIMSQGNKLIDLLGDDEEDDDVSTSQFGTVSSSLKQYMCFFI